MKILFVCAGNICRSPLAEGLLRAQLAQHDDTRDVLVDSAGIGDWHAGQRPDPRAIHAARRRGVDLSTQRARQVTVADFRAFELILCADRSNLLALQERAPADAGAEIALLLDWCGLGAEAELPDPYLGDAADFEHVCALLEAAAAPMIARLAARQTAQSDAVVRGGSADA